MPHKAADRIRNVALIGHRGCGKTSLHEAILFEAGATTLLGSVADGSTVSDHEPDEREREMSIDASVACFEHDGRKIGVFNCEGTLYAIEDRCSHDDGPLAEGEFDPATCTVECPRHGSLFDLTTGRPKTLPAYAPVDTFPVSIEDDTIILEV